MPPDQAGLSLYPFDLAACDQHGYLASLKERS